MNIALLYFERLPSLHGTAKVTATVAAIMAAVGLLAGHIVVEAEATAAGPAKKDFLKYFPETPSMENLHKKAANNPVYF